MTVAEETAVQIGLFGAAPSEAPKAGRTSGRAASSVAPKANGAGRVRQTGLGICTGDIIETSYGTGPYEVWSIWGPHLWHADYSAVYLHETPIISLTLVQPGTTPRRGYDGSSFINEVYRVGDRWFSAGGELYRRAHAFTSGKGRPHDEVYRRDGGFSAQGALPDSESHPWSLPYPRLEGVDYDAGDGKVWTCASRRGLGWPEGERCCDFNGERSGPKSWDPVWCPRCGRAGCRLVIVFRAPALAATVL